MTPEWRRCSVRDLLSSVTAGVSVNGQSRPREAGEIGVLKISAVTYGIFRPEENKAVLPTELERARENPRAGCILVSRANTADLVGATVYVAKDHPDLVLPDKLWQLFPDTALADGRWLQAFLSMPSMRARISEAATGTSGSMKNIGREQFLALDISVPPLPEQRKIAAILSSVDDAIEASHAVIDQLQVVKKAMMAELLTKGLPGRHKHFKQTEIGAVPDEWRMGVVSDFLLLQRGFDLTEKAAVPGSIPVVSSGGISYYHNQASAKPPGVVTGRKGRLGKVFLLEQPFWPHDTTLWVCDFKGNSPEYVVWYLRSLHLEQFDSATAVPTLNRNIVHPLPAAFPPVEEQMRIALILSAVESREASEVETLRGHERLKSALMSVLLTGEVRVKRE